MYTGNQIPVYMVFCIYVLYYFILRVKKYVNLVKQKGARDFIYLQRFVWWSYIYGRDRPTFTLK